MHTYVYIGHLCTYICTFILNVYFAIHQPTLPVPEPGTDLASVNLRFDEHYLPRTLGGVKHRPASQEGCVVGVANAADGARVLKWINSVIDKVSPH